MKKHFYIEHLVLFVILFNQFGCAESGPGQQADGLLAEIRKDLDSNKSVIIYKMPNKDRSSEQYADWSMNLNDFIQVKSDRYRVHESNGVFEEKYLRDYSVTDDGYTLFLKKGKPGFLYRGVIVEKTVYMAVDHYWQNKELSGIDKAFLPELIEIKIK